MVHRLHPGKGQVHLRLRISCRRASGRLEGGAVGVGGSSLGPGTGGTGPCGAAGNCEGAQGSGWAGVAGDKAGARGQREMLQGPQQVGASGLKSSLAGPLNSLPLPASSSPSLALATSLCWIPTRLSLNPLRDQSGWEPVWTPAPWGPPHATVLPGEQMQAGRREEGRAAQEPSDTLLQRHGPVPYYPLLPPQAISSWKLPSPACISSRGSFPDLVL